MTRDDIIRMARESEQYADKFCSGIGDTGQHHWFDAYNERFAALVAAHEREACAKVCEARNMGDNNREDAEAKRCAAAIRARGEVKP